MGYYSDVALALSKHGSTLLKKRLGTVVGDERIMFDHADLHKVDAATGQELWRWDSVKWYEDFPDVAFIHGFLEDLDEQHYLFVRVGEECGDIETRGNFWSNVFQLDVSTSIVTA